MLIAKGKEEKEGKVGKGRADPPERRQSKIFVT